MKSILVFLILVVILFTYCPVGVYADTLELDAASAILIEAETGRVLYEENADEQRHPASVTKIMTLLLVFESIELGKISLSDKVSVSENAARMGGSQIYLEPGEEMTVEDLIKAVTVCSANDAAVALAEYVAGSEEKFVSMMNDKAAELSMKGTNFENTNGLDDTTDTHLTTARDIAIMSSELLSHKGILKYTTIWQDTVRNGEFTLTNTNKLIRFYSGANGLKTGYTSKSGYCISASAMRDGMQLIAVIMGAKTSNSRNISVKKLLDFGFANYAYREYPASSAVRIRVVGGISDFCTAGYNTYKVVTDKELAKDIKEELSVCEFVKAPIKKGDVVGKITYTLNGEILSEENVYALEDVKRMNFNRLFCEFLKKYFLF